MITTKKYLSVQDLDSWKLAFSVTNKVWDIVLTWEYLGKDTVGKQFIRSTDSISANIAEGYGRYSKKDKIRFYRIAMGSLKESQDWLLKAKHRCLLTEIQFEELNADFNHLPKAINSLIKFTNEKLSF